MVKQLRSNAIPFIKCATFYNLYKTILPVNKISDNGKKYMFLIPYCMRGYYQMLPRERNKRSQQWVILFYVMLHYKFFILLTKRKSILHLLANVCHV